MLKFYVDVQVTTIIVTGLRDFKMLTSFNVHDRFIDLEHVFVEYAFK